MICFLDLSPAKTLDSNYAEAAEVGDPVNFLYSCGLNTDLIFTLQYGTNVQLSNFGNGKSITRDGSWQSMADSSPYQYGSSFMIEDTISVVSCFRFDSTDYSELFDIGPIRCFYMSSSLQFKNNQGQNTTISLNIIPTKSYMITCKRYPDPNNQGSFLLDWELENLADNSIQNANSTGGNPTPTNLVTFRLGRSNTNFSHHQGPLIIFQGNEQTEIDLAQDFCREFYDGPSSTEETTEILAENFVFQIETN